MKQALDFLKVNNLIRSAQNALSKPGLIKKPSFAISDEDISITEHTKYLGVQVDQYMNWENHINHVITKISRSLGMIRHAKTFSL